MAQQAFDVVRLDDQRTQLEMAAALIASLDVEVERAFGQDEPFQL